MLREERLRKLKTCPAWRRESYEKPHSTREEVTEKMEPGSSLESMVGR